MYKYEINVAEAHTMKGWDGKPAYRHHLLVNLNSYTTGEEAAAEYQRLLAVYPAPKFRMTLRRVRVVSEIENMLDSAT